MLRRTIGLLTFAVVALFAGAVLAAPSTPEEELQASRALFRGDTRLQAKVGLAERDRPLGELLADLGGRLHLRLSPAPETVDVKVTVYLDDRPAADVLPMLADHLDFQWRKVGKGYQLVQTEAAKRRAAALGEAELRPQWERIQARLRKVTGLVAVPAAQLQARQAEVRKELARPDLTQADRDRLTEEDEALSDALRRGAALAMRVYTTLNPGQVRQVFSGGLLRFSTFDRSLPPALADQVHADVEELMKGSGAPWKLDPATSQADVIVQVRELHGGVTPRSASERTLGFAFNTHSGDSKQYRPFAWFPGFRNRPTAPAVPTRTDDPELKRAVDLALPSPAAVPPIGAWPAGLATLGEIGEALHRKTGLDWISDSFVRERLDRKALAGEYPVVEILDRLRDELRCEWRKEGKLLLVRSAVYYRDRPAEVPERVMRPWRAQVSAAGGLTVDNQAALAAAVDDRQARRLGELWGWALEGLPVTDPLGHSKFRSNLQALRLWAMLAPRQKEAAAQPAGVPVAQMAPAQQVLFLAALTDADPDGTPGPMRASDTPTPEGVAGGSLRVNSRQYREQWFEVSFNGSAKMRMSSREGPDGSFETPRVGQYPVVPSGSPLDMLGTTFSFYLARQEKPARQAILDLPRTAAAR